MKTLLRSARRVVRAIGASGLTIYDALTDRPDLYLSTEQLEAVLTRALRGLKFDLPIRTRSRKVKEAVCNALGYPIPKAFRKTQPRFPGQNFDTYVQKGNNLQIWNEDVAPSRRYVLIRVDDRHRVARVRVVTGDVIAVLDKTGTLTQKFQARSREPITNSKLVSQSDTPHLQLVLARSFSTPSKSGAISVDSDAVMAISDLYATLLSLVGQRISNPGMDQERIRAAALHELVQRGLGGSSFHDTGQFPDVPEQLLELKLQTSPTIDLGLVCPESTEAVADIPQVRHCDIRYGVFYASIEGNDVSIDHIVLSTGEDFFTFFRRFGGLVTNRKIQIPLPTDFFADSE